MYLLRSKDEVIEIFKLYKNEVENQLSKKIKAIKSDRGGEYESPFEEFCVKYRIIHQIAQQNTNKTIMILYFGELYGCLTRSSSK